MGEAKRRRLSETLAELPDEDRHYEMPIEMDVSKLHPDDWEPDPDALNMAVLFDGGSIRGVLPPSEFDRMKRHAVTIPQEYRDKYKDDIFNGMAANKHLDPDVAENLIR